MATNSFAIDSGLDVLTSDGEKLGTTGDVFSAASTRSTTQTDMQAAAPRGPDEGEAYGAQGETADSQTASATDAGDPEILNVPAAGVSSDIRTGNQGPDTGAGTMTAVPGLSAGAADSPTPAGAASLSASDTKYFEVKTGGVLGIGASTAYYVPFSAVSTVAPGDSVTLSCTRAQADELYRERPPSLPGEPSE